MREFNSDTLYHLAFCEPVDIRVGVRRYITTQYICVYFFYTTDESRTLCYRLPDSDYGFVVGAWFDKITQVFQEVPYEHSIHRSPDA